jgi:hypothetical protein
MIRRDSCRGWVLSLDGEEEVRRGFKRPGARAPVSSLPIQCPEGPHSLRLIVSVLYTNKQTFLQPIVQADSFFGLQNT